MIINYPTALYEPLLPQHPDDGGNVTFTISMDTPPRSSITTVKIPAAWEKKQLPPRPTGDIYSRLGQRLYTTARSNSLDIGSSKKQYEAGQVLEFVNAPLSDVQPMLVADVSELRHDTNILDLGTFGIDPLEYERLIVLASNQLADLNTALGVARQGRSDTDLAINENQKDQNEANKAIRALEQLVASDPSVQSILDMLKNKLVVLQQDMIVLVQQANTYADQASALTNQILAVAQLVR